MNLTNYYWYFKSAIPEHICDDIVKYGHQLQDQMAVTGKYVDKSHSKKLNSNQVKDLKKIRNSSVTWMNDRWIYNEIHPYINMANESAGWNFEWDFSESCQFTKYKKGQFYDWHCDSWDEPYQKKQEDPLHGKIRKLSVTVTLSDPKDYKGGELEFDFRNKDPNKPRKLVKCKEILPKGSLVVFPSFVWHRICPVKSGERNSLVIWNLGYPFK
jgi:PKHD-type hydroxylase|tara:strand:- start:611 stop:1249 length:639 start_codon:yes stop_codon:yes gene_type:complete